MLYALVQFLVVYHFRHLNNNTLSAQHALQKTQLRLHALDEKRRGDQRRTQPLTIKK